LLSFHDIFLLLGEFPKLVHLTPSIKAGQGLKGFKHFASEKGKNQVGHFF
jgi:hypothetical protein